MLFLEPRPDGRFTVTGWAQGTFRIARHARNGEERATEDTAALPVFDPRTRQFRAEGIRQIPLGELRERVLAAERHR